MIFVIFKPGCPGNKIHPAMHNERHLDASLEQQPPRMSMRGMGVNQIELLRTKLYELAQTGGKADRISARQKYYVNPKETQLTPYRASFSGEQRGRKTSLELPFYQELELPLPSPPAQFSVYMKNFQGC